MDTTRTPCRRGARGAAVPASPGRPRTAFLEVGEGVGPWALDIEGASGRPKGGRLRRSAQRWRGLGVSLRMRCASQYGPEGGSMGDHGLGCSLVLDDDSQCLEGVFSGRHKEHWRWEEEEEGGGY